MKEFLKEKKVEKQHIQKVDLKVPLVIGSEIDFNKLI
jgi:hypothetical protein